MSLSKSPNKTLYGALGVVIAGLSVGILVLALLVTTSGPWVRQVIVQNSAAAGASSVDQGLTVVFDRPINSTDFAGVIDIQPKVDYTVSHRNQQLNITFNQNLLSNTDYVLTVYPGLEDDLGKRMEQEYTYEFTTAEPSFTYLERNRGSGAIDKVIEEAPLSQESHILYGAHARVKSFARNASYLAVVETRADDTDELHVVDLGNREEWSVDLPHDVRVANLKFSPVDNQFVFITQTIPRADGSESYFKDYSNRLYRYDIDGEQLQPVDTLSDEGNVESVSYSRDGQALLYRTLDSEYYLTGAAQATEPTLIGKYEDSGGFDRTNTKLAFLYKSGAAIYDAQAGGLQEVPDIRVGGRISTPAFLQNSDDLIYLRDPLDAQTDGRVEVCTANADERVEEPVAGLEPSTRFYGDPVVSYDDRYVLINTTFGSQGTSDPTGSQQPADTRLVLYDRFNHEVIDPGDTRGTDPVWNR
jgi:hypothetical protein